MGRRKRKGRPGWKISASEVRARAAAGTTQPLPVPAPKADKAERKRQRRMEKLYRRFNPVEREPRHEEFEQEDRHIASILVLHASGPLKPMRAIRTTLDPHHHRKRIEEYGGRNRLLEGLGFASYKDYLASPLWDRIRGRMLAAFPSCRICGRPARHVHHIRYTKAVLLGKDDRQLVTLCAGCHYDVEFRERDRQKLSPKQARSKLRFRITMAAKEAQ